MKVGFVGIGIMGEPMARNLMRSGHELTVHNRSRKRAERLAEEGATLVQTPREVAENSEITITMLPTPPDIKKVVAGEDGVLSGAREGSIIVDMSTSSPLLARELAEKAHEKNVSMLDAPVSGGDVGAIEGTLSIMVGGSEHDFVRAKPLFEAIGKTVTHVGPAGSGQVTKAANQIVVALVIEAVSEALVLAEKGGVSSDRVLDVLSGGLAGNKVMEVKRGKFLGREFEPGGKVQYHRKDLDIALATGREYGVALPVTALVHQMFGALISKGRADWDHSALISLLDEWAGSESEYRE